MEAIGWILVYLAVWVAATTACMAAFCKGRERIVVTPVFLLVRFRRVPRFLERAQPRLARHVFTVGVAAFVLAMLQFYDIAISSIVTRFMRRVEAAAPFTPLLPGVTISIELFLFLIPGIVLAIVVHELAHALAARAEGLRVKSFGAAVFLGLVPGAFVELDEEELQRARLLPKLRVYAAGTAANLATALALTAIIAGILQAGVGFYILDVVEGAPAHAAGVVPGSLILSVNGTVPASFTELRQLLANSTAVVMELEHEGQRYTATMTKGADGKYGIIIGVLPVALMQVFGDAYTAYAVFNIVDLAMKINLALAVINAAPILITDGAKFLDAILGPRRRTLSIAIQVATLLLLLLNMNLELIG